MKKNRNTVTVEIGRDSPTTTTGNEYKRNHSTSIMTGPTLLSARKNDNNRKSKAPNMLSFLPSNSKYVPNSNIK